MAAGLLTTILVLVIGYSHLPIVVSLNDLEMLMTSLNKLGTDSFYPGKSCKDIYDNNMASRGVSGEYWIETDKVYKVYCDMELSCGGIKGGWMRIAKVDTSQGHDCPVGWKKITSPRPLCRGSGDAAGCYSAYIANHNAKYNAICGKLRGYQQGTPSAFLPGRKYSIDGPYLEGVSITVGTPRKHVWSYAVGYSKLKTVNTVDSCPCRQNPGSNPPSYVKDHYFCESGASIGGIPLNQFFGLDPLWDGKGCIAGDDCCSTLGAPWFYRYFTQPEKGAVEVRICRDESYYNEATLVEQVELYIQ